MSDSNLNSRKEKAAWGLSIPRGTARGLLEIEFTTRRALLEELTRVNPDRALLVLRQQPDAAP